MTGKIERIPDGESETFIIIASVHYQVKLVKSTEAVPLQMADFLILFASYVNSDIFALLRQFYVVACCIGDGGCKCGKRFEDLLFNAMLIKHLDNIDILS